MSLLCDILRFREASIIYFYSPKWHEAPGIQYVSSGPAVSMELLILV